MCPASLEMSCQSRYEKLVPFNAVLKFNILPIYFQCKILVGFSTSNFKDNSTNI